MDWAKYYSYTLEWMAFRHVISSRIVSHIYHVTLVYHHCLINYIGNLSIGYWIHSYYNGHPFWNTHSCMGLMHWRDDNRGLTFVTQEGKL